MIGNSVGEVHVDMGYRGHDCQGAATRTSTATYEICKTADARFPLTASIQNCSARPSHFGFLVGKATLQGSRFQLSSAHGLDNRPQ